MFLNFLMNAQSLTFLNIYEPLKAILRFLTSRAVLIKALFDNNQTNKIENCYQ